MADINGNNRSNIIISGASDDVINAGGGNDLIISGAGDDTINGGRGIDRIFETGDVDFTLTTSSLTGLGNDRVQAIEIAQLTGASPTT